MQLLISCESEENKPLVEINETPPVVTVVEVQNGPGMAKIYYEMPKDDNLLYVMAVYEPKVGNVVETKSSIFKNYIEVEGFSRENDYKVDLVTVNKSEIKSTPVQVTIHPTDALIHEVYSTLKSIPTFGGVNIRFTNEEAKEYILHTEVKDSTGTWMRDVDRLYTSATNVNYSIRGFNPLPTDFRFYITDKWQNSSDTLFVTHTPLFEEEFDKSLWKDAALSNDFNRPKYGPLKELWTPGERTYFFMDENMPGLSLPNWFTIDLGRRYIFGRMIVENVRHADAWMYAKGTPEAFEIWASNEPDPDWNKWTLLGSFTCVKPSGAPLGTVTEEDRTQIMKGDNYDFEPSDQSYRYVRFKTLATFGGTPQTYLLELSFFGMVDNNN
ncbi:MAG: DUF4959 domain-containing protein [Fermentimonas sp.]